MASTTERAKRWSAKAMETEDAPPTSWRAQARHPRLAGGVSALDSARAMGIPYSKSWVAGLRRPRRGRVWRRCWVVLLLAGLAACARTPKPAALSRNGQLALAQISTYLNNLQKFRADFTQAGPRGPQRGVVWIDRPGRLRVEYAYPGRETILANRGELLILTPSTGATTTMPVSKTPLDILLRDTIPLTGPVTVTALRRQPGMVSLTLVKTNAPGQGTLTLSFSADPLKLRGLTITDRTGRITSLALERIVRNPHFVPGQFTLRPASAGGRS